MIRLKMIGLLLLLLAVLAAVLIWGSSPTASGLIASILQGNGITPRGPVRLNLSENAYDRHHAALKTGLTVANVRKNPNHVAYVYHDKLSVTWAGSPATILGFKDQHLAGKSQVDYGHIVTKDGKHVVAFESIAPAVVNGNSSVLTVRLNEVQGTRVAKLTFITEPTATAKKVRFAVL